MADFGLCPNDRLGLNESPADRLGIKKAAREETDSSPCCQCIVWGYPLIRDKYGYCSSVSFGSRRGVRTHGCRHGDDDDDNTRSKRFFILFPIIVSEV